MEGVVRGMLELPSIMEGDDGGQEERDETEKLINSMQNSWINFPKASSKSQVGCTEY
jgi:hypothetical protein